MQYVLIITGERWHLAVRTFNDVLLTAEGDNLEGGREEIGLEQPLGDVDMPAFVARRVAELELEKAGITACERCLAPSEPDA